jgi:type I restriction enzyme, S subunit
MRTGWALQKLGELSEIINGGTPDTKVSKYWGGDNLWITPKDMGKLTSIYVSQTERTLTTAGLNASSAKLLPVNSIILSTRAPIGHLAITGKKIATNQGCKGIIPKENLSSLFLFYFLKHSVELLNDLGSGATFKELSGSSLADVAVPLPPLADQQRIVETLGKAFAAIAKAKANAERNLQNSRELFDSHLETVFSKPESGWKISKLGECAKFIDYRGKTPTKTAAGVRLITAKNVKYGYLLRAPEEFIAAKDYATWMTRGIPNKGDVLFTTEAPLANVAQLDTDERVAFAQRIIILQAEGDYLNPTFLKYVLLSKPIQKSILAHGTGATVQGIKSRLLKDIQIYFPESVVEQQAIVAKLDALSAETKKLEAMYQQKLAALEELKASILQKAFSGELTGASA